MGSRRDTVVVIALTMLAGAVGQAFGRFTFSILLPAVKADLLGSYSSAGFLGTMNVGAYLVGTIIVSLVSLRVALPTIVKGGLCLSTAGLTVLATAPNLAVLLMGMTLAGLGGAAIWVPSPGIAASMFPPERRGYAIGLAGAGIGAGIVFATQLTNLVRLGGDPQAWRPVWAIEAGIAAAVTAATVRWLHPPPVAAGDPPRLSALRRIPGWLALVLTYAAFGLAYILFISYIVAGLEHDAGFGTAHAALVFAVLGITSVFGGILLGRLSDRVGRRPTLVAGFAVAAVCALGVLTGREPWALLAAGAFGLCFSGLTTVVAAYLGDHASPREFGAAFGALTMCFGVAQTIGPEVGGWLADHTGAFAWTYTVSAVTWALGAVAASRLPRTRVPIPTAEGPQSGSTLGVRGRSPQ